MATKTKALTEQPVSDLQLNQLEIKWVPIREVKPNAYNPNKMTPNERVLLRQSLLEDGWTQPIVTLEDGVIVDGEQRWTVAQMKIKPEDIQELIDKMTVRKKEGHSISPSILKRLDLAKKQLIETIGDNEAGIFADLTGGLVPITVLDLGDDAHKMISTIRHNRARGVHQIDAMAGITQDLIRLGLDIDDLENRLGMTDEEVNRFMQIAGGQDEAFDALLQDQEFSQSLVIKGLGELDPDVRKEIEMSNKANEAYREEYAEITAHKKKIEHETMDLIKGAETTEDRALTQTEKDRIKMDVTRKYKPPERLERPKVKKLMLYILPEEHAIVEQAIGETNQAVNLMKACKAIIAHRKVFNRWLEAVE